LIFQFMGQDAGMKNLIEGFTRQLSEALRIGQAVDLVRPGSDIRNILISGMGSSGIGANLVESLTFGRVPIPITVSKGYNIPQFVSPHTLFIACSYSGDAEETLAAVQKAMLKRAHIICITSGGRLLELAREYNLFYMQIPAASAPRGMIGYMIISLLYALYHTNLIGAAFIKETENAIESLNRSEKAILIESEIIARKLKGKLPVIYCDGRLHAMAMRFQNQLNENAKQLAHVNTFPEMNHNELEGWQFPQNVLQQIQVIYLYSDHDHERVEKRMEICRDIFEKKSNPIIDIVAEGASLLEQYYYLIHLTDWISYFLARENQADPNEPGAIDFVKEELEKNR
jgi:glucose/mannose-6-phosphate isomerase